MSIWARIGSCVLTFICSGFVQVKASAEPLWLPIVSTQPTVSAVLANLSGLKSKGDALQVISSDDCKNLRQGLFLVSAGVYKHQQEAESVLLNWQNKGVQDAYLRQCEVRPASRLAFGIPLIDPSFAQLRSEPINWDLDDAVSTVRPLNDHLVAVTVPRYQPDPEDSREGFRSSVRLYKQLKGTWLDLSADCIDADFSIRGDQLALSCVSEVSGPNLLRSLQIFDVSGGRLLLEVPRCTRPQLSEKGWVCQKQTVNAEGGLVLNPQQLGLP